MNWKHYAMTSIVLAMCSAVQAQQHRGQSGHNAAAPHHSGGMQPGHPQARHPVSAEEHMWNQWYHEQMMMNEMMGGARGRRSHAQGSSGRPSASQAGQNQSGQTKPAARAGSGNHEAGKNGPAHTEPSKKSAAKPAHAAQKPQSRNGKHASKTHVAADQSIISLLRMTHTKLEGADHDYGGHRVNAMRHISSAVEDLGSTAPLGSIALASTGNLPQSRSDQVLRDALVHLKNTEGSLGSGADRAERHHRARTAVAHAIRELETALRVR